MMETTDVSKETSNEEEMKLLEDENTVTGSVTDDHAEIQTDRPNDRPVSGSSTELFMSSIVDRLCENCAKIRESILTLSDSECSGGEECEQEVSTKEDIKEKVIPEGEGPRQESNRLLRNLHRRTISEIDWQQISLFVQDLSSDPNVLGVVEGKPVTSTKEKIKHVFKEGKEDIQVAFKAMENINLDSVTEQAEKCIMCMIHTGWRAVSHIELPEWLRDNDFLSHGHRPPLPSFKKCFGSMFRIHTETGNIWTHLVGLVLIVIAMLYVYLAPNATQVDFPNRWQDYLVLAAFFTGAILCLLFSWLFHTLYCHSAKVHDLFSKLDYSGIAFLIVGSSIPCFYYGFYCRKVERMIYTVVMSLLGFASVIVSLWKKFAKPRYRPLRAGLFLCLGCSGFIPTIHGLVINGFWKGMEQGAVGWLLLMALLYIGGALLYAFRVPERFFPGKCNFMFQSHQIFHVCVVVAAFIHLHGIFQMANYRLSLGLSCQSVDS